MLSYTVKRSARRRTVSLEIRDAQLVVRAPVSVPDSALANFVERKRSWIERKVREQAHALAQVPQYVYESGARLPLLGQTLRLCVGQGPRGSVVRTDDQLQVTCSTRSRQPQTEQARALVQGWYRDTALTLLADKTTALADAMKLRHSGVRVRATRSKWGHCTSRGEIQYNWQILLAPEAVVDYLVAHEVCHLRHHNHSPAFWHLVERVCPDYRALRQWLKANGRNLVL